MMVNQEDVKIFYLKTLKKSILSSVFSAASKNFLADTVSTSPVAFTRNMA